MDLDFKLNKIGLKHVNGFQYNVGYYLFDAIVYLLGYLVTSIDVQRNSIMHL
jgi:hypothetical protein